MDRTPSDDDPRNRADDEPEAKTGTERERGRERRAGERRDRPSAETAAADAPSAATGSDRTAGAPDPESGRRGGAIGDLLPEATVDSNWWYWIAAVPAYFLLVFALGIGAALLFLFAFALDVAGLAGLGSVIAGLVATLGFVGLALVGLVVAVLFPVAVYVDARAIERADLDIDWRPDPALYGLLALAAVLVTNFVLSVPFAVYYLYRRHQHLGTP